MQKRKELEEKYPKVLNPKFLFTVRVIIALIALLSVKVVSGTLPFYRNKCLYDNVQASFQHLQIHFNSDAVIIFVELMILILSNIKLT